MSYINILSILRNFMATIKRVFEILEILHIHFTPIKHQTDTQTYMIDESDQFFNEIISVFRYIM